MDDPVEAINRLMGSVLWRQEVSRRWSISHRSKPVLDTLDTPYPDPHTVMAGTFASQPTYLNTREAWWR